SLAEEEGEGVRGKWLVRLVVAAVGTIALGASAIAVRAARAELASLEPDRYIVSRPAGEVWLAAATDVSLTTTKGVKLQGWRLAAVLADVAAQDTRLRAVVLAGCYTDTDEHIRRDYHRWGPLSSLPARWAARWAGLVPLHPLASVAAIAPRAVLFIQEDADPIVDSDSAARLY